MKTCTKCQETLEDSRFHRNSKAPDGLDYRCKGCKDLARKSNIEHERSLRRAWQRNNKDKVTASCKKWYLQNKDHWNTYAKLKASERRAIKLQRSFQGWLTELTEVYKNCPDGHHVDHIIPLKGKLVSGLHVPWNLQYLPASENLKKSNKFITE